MYRKLMWIGFSLELGTVQASKFEGPFLCRVCCRGCFPPKNGERGIGQQLVEEFAKAGVVLPVISGFLAGNWHRFSHHMEFKARSIVLWLVVC